MKNIGRGGSCFHYVIRSGCLSRCVFSGKDIVMCLVRCSNGAPIRAPLPCMVCCTRKGGG